ncbi:MAG: hypothetical protein AAFV53_15570 [Myxococcota bacterium]
MDLESPGHPAAHIPPPCWTRTEDRHNPCYVCHREGVAPNFIDDSDLQEAYAFPMPALENPWRNLFIEHPVANTWTDADIDAWVRTNNYAALADDLRAGLWDIDGDGSWAGVVPDAGFVFEDGVDIGPDGPTGWRAFVYAPFPGTFWPTNGATDDVLIRLPVPFRTTDSGQPDPTVYTVNLAIVEALLTRADVSLPLPVDEAALGVDLDKDGQLGHAGIVRYDWAPIEGRTMSYVGAARAAQDMGAVHLAAGLYPEGTEFLHSVRYLDVVDGQVRMAARMKELRYSRKIRWRGYLTLEQLAISELKEKEEHPDRLRPLSGSVEAGWHNDVGWVYQGFIEDETGRLRPQSRAESALCMGCHSGYLGAPQDTTFSFARKIPGPAGWGHWHERGGLVGFPEPRDARGRPEVALYLKRNGAGDEVRANTEMMAKLPLSAENASKMSSDISWMIMPSPARARALNRAYRALVAEQSFTYGRDPVLAPVSATVHQQVTPDQPTGLRAVQ